MKRATGSSSNRNRPPLESHSPEAVRHVEAITAWWAANRLAAPLLFADELRAALRQLQREQATTNDAVSQTKG